MTNDKKVYGDERRTLILDWLKHSSSPLTGSELANRTNVSRQVIVQDISLLKAKNMPIIATSQGYVYLDNGANKETMTRIIASQHHPEQTENELSLIVDFGVNVKDVIVEHPIYGDITASLMIRSRYDVKHFIQKLKDTNASLLSELTEGTHLHTLEATSEHALDQACNALREAGYLLES